MRFILQILISIVWVFLINTIFYFVSDDYQQFLKNLKYSPTIDKTSNSLYSESKFIDESENKWEEKKIENGIIEIPNEIETENIPQSQTVLWIGYQAILDKFQKYSLKQLELNTNLFDLTNEYPDPYYEYYSKDVTLYFFPGNRYTQIHDVFEYLSKQHPYTINALDNFWTNSFYINLDPVIRDNYIRLVVSNKGIVFGLKVHTSRYEEIKNILINITQ